jgi:hypothetical protein
MPEWLLGLISGVVVVYVGDSLRESRDRRHRGNQLLAKVHVLVDKVRPEPLLFLAGLDQQRAERDGAELWRQWQEHQEALHVFAFESGPAAERAVKQAATHISLSIQATRNAIEAADDDSAARASTKETAQEMYAVALECVDDLDRAFAGRSLSGLLKSERRRA